MTWTDMLWLIANSLLAVVSLMCLGRLIHRGSTHILTRLSYTVTPIGASIGIVGYLHHSDHAIYLGELLEIVGMLIVTIRIYYYLNSIKPNGKHGAYVGKEARRGRR